jgi:hypothetical protein
MTFDLLSDPTLIERFDAYFKHPDPDHHVLEMGDRAIACKNAKTALNKLGFRTAGGDPLLYDQSLFKAVEKFQEETGHRNVDGAIGPGTRARLVSELLRKSGAPKFAELDASEAGLVPTVFLSYAWDDASRVDKLDQWLRDHGISVIRDTSSFSAGSRIESNIWKSVLSADKVIAVYSAKSKSRDWPSLERQIAEQVESQLKTSLLIYLRLDETPLKAYDQNRIAIEARGKTLKQVGLEIQKSLGIALERARIDYDEDAPV